MKKFLVITALLAAASLTVCAGGRKDGGKIKIGVSMPTRNLQRWNQDGENIKAQLENAGYTVDLQYAGDNDIAAQRRHLAAMLSGGCKALVIAAVDGGALSDTLAEAERKGVPVISYDRLITGSGAVTYYATFDNYRVGVLQGKYIEDKLGLQTAPGPFNIELVAGAPPDDTNVMLFFVGAMSVLEPYLSRGTLRVLSGETSITQCATPHWLASESQKRMERLIAAHGYGPAGTHLDAVLCSNDSTANGVTEALKRAGYAAPRFPVITGQDCDILSVKNILAGAQSMSIFKDTRDLASRAATMVRSVAEGETPAVNTVTSDGGREIPTYLCSPVVVDRGNIQTVLVSSGYYTEADLR